MVPIIVENSRVPTFFDFFGLKLYGIMLFPFIFIIPEDQINRHEQSSRKKLTKEIVINHEKIHFRQCLETLVIGFYVIFIIQYLVNYYMTSNSAYSFVKICFEKEAYKHCHNLNYLRYRKPYSWFLDTY